MKLKRTKKLLALLLTLVMLVGLLPTMALATDYSIHFTSNGITSGEYDSAVECDVTVSGCAITKLYIKTITTDDAASVLAGENFRYNVYPLDGATLGARWKNGNALTDDMSKIETTAAAIKAKFSGLNFNEQCSKYYFAVFDATAKYGLLIQVKGAAITIDTSALDEQIARVWDVSTATYKNGFYTENDRYNGTDKLAKDADNPTCGFWYALTKDGGPLKTALGTFENQTQVNNAYAALKAAIDKLIPISLANTTLLHEAVETCKGITNGTSSSPMYTDASWNNFTAVRSEAQALMGQMFNADGSANTTYNVYAAQADVEAKAAALTQAYNNLFPIVLNEKLGVWKAAADWLLDKSDLDSSKYDATTWGTWEEKLAALEGVKNSTITLNSDYDAYTKAIVEAAAAYNTLADKNESITVHVRFADNFGAANPTYALADAEVATYDGDVTLSGIGRTINGLLTEISYDGAQKNAGSTKSGSQLIAYVEGELAIQVRSGNPDSWKTAIINGTTVGEKQLHDGDHVVLVRVEYPWVYRYTGEDDFSAPYRIYSPFSGLLEIQGNRVMEVEAGAPLTLEVKRTPGAAGAEKRIVPASNVSLVLSEAQDTQSAARGAQTLNNTGDKTGDDGKATTTIYREGWYRLEAVNTAEHTKARGYDANSITGGDYSGLNGGDYVLVHVTPSSNETALREQFQAALDKVFNAHGEDYYGARWSGEQGVQTIYNAACKVIEGKDPDKPLLGDAKSASDSAIAAIEDIVALVEGETSTALKAFSIVCNMLPDDVSLLTKLQIPAVTQLKKNYEDMTPYQRSLLTTAQSNKYKEILDAFGTDGSALPEEKWYTLHVVIDNEADRAKYDFGFYSIYSLTDIKDNWNSIENYTTDKIASYANQNFSFAPGTGSMTLYLLPVGYNGGEPAFSVSGVTVDGAPYILNERESSNPYTYTRHGNHRYLQQISFTEDIYSTFSAPYNDITVHLTVRDSNDPKTTDELKAEAKAELTRAYQNDYPKSRYNAAQWAELTSAYNAGLAAIDAAEESGIEAAKAAAIAAMGAVETIDKADHSDSTVGSLGSVHVIVENTTYTGAPASMQGRFVERDMPLEADTTMMTAVLDALALEGYSWIGTGPGSSTGREITYLATITDSDGATLSEFDGEPTSGWMGVLNDWFVNESFASFTTTATARDYRVVDGDEIRVMFTLKGYGRDLGGSWGNPDTSIKELSYTGGTLTPKFDGAMTDYVLTLTGGAVTVTPTAANKNYQVKTFLNQKNTARDVEYYRRGETIPARAGDVIWIGCGEKNWLSMNNQGAEATGYSGTWYSITVVDSNSAAAAEQAIEKIGSVTYANYESKVSLVKAARAAYDNLIAEAKGQVTNSAKLTDAEEKIAGYKKIDNVKALLAALPKDATDAQVLAAQAKIEAADRAYKALTDAQKDYITVSDAANYNALVERLTALAPDTEAEAIQGSDAAPAEVSEGEITVTADDGTTVTTETEKTVDTKTNDDGSVTETVNEKTTETVTDPEGNQTVKETVVENETTTNTVTNDDGSVTDTVATKETTTETVTDAEGNQTATETAKESSVETTTSSVENADGSVTETVATETKETVTETVTDADGKETTTVSETTENKSIEKTTDAEGKVSGTGTVESKTTVKDEAGNTLSTSETIGTVAVSTDDKGTVSEVTTATTKTTDAVTGEVTEQTTVTTEAEMANGTTGKTVENEKGETLSAETNVSEEALQTAQEGDGVIDIPVTVNGNSGATVQLNLPEMAEGEQVWAEIGTTVTDGGNVAYLKLAENVVKLLPNTRTGSVIVPVKGSCELIIKNNAKSFSDVNEDAWYGDSVKFVTAREIFNGNGNGTFAPTGTMNRAMAAQIIYNYAGGGAAGSSTFSDVDEGAWYAKAVGWAAEQGIINGYNGEYAPLAAITRQDLVKILYFYAKQAGFDVSAGEDVDLLSYADGADVSDYAVEPMRWAIAVGLIKGYTDNTLRPKATATRAEVAALMQRMVENVW